MLNQRRITSLSLHLVLVSVLIAPRTHAFSLHSSPKFSKWYLATKENTALLATIDKTDIDDCLQGVSQFEEWWERVSPSASDTSNFENQLKHSSFDFGQLRGLKLHGQNKNLGNGKPILSVPRKVVLYSSMNAKSEDFDWDTSLAVQLLQEYKKEKASDIYGYCSLLTRGTSYSPDTLPPPTAPHALRNWSPEQLKYISSSTAGKNLIELEKSQMNKWNTKYDSLPSTLKNSYSRELFHWALEAVHSRSFRGDFGPLVSIGRVPIIVSGLVQIIAIALGSKALLNSTPSNNMDAIVIACTIVAILPIILFNFVLGSSSSGDGVLLPMIDSANHKADADSSIQYDPFKDSFELRLGNKCLGKDDQVFISYGNNKSDSELLLNYGFLPDVVVDDSESTEENYISRLASTFVTRNS